MYNEEPEYKGFLELLLTVMLAVPMGILLAILSIQEFFTKTK